MKKIIGFLLFLSLFFITSCGKEVSCDERYIEVEDGCAIDVDSYMNTDEYWTITHDGVEREFIIYIPDDLSDNAPLVFVLHGHGGNALNMQGKTMMNDIADDNGFAVVYPNGLKDRLGSPHWNADFDFSTSDDEGFLIKLKNYLIDTFSFSESNVFISGHSNGGFMGYAMSMNQPGEFKAMASVGGTMSGNAWNREKPSISTNVLQIHGEADPIVPIDGSMAINGGWGGAPDMATIIDFWKEVNEVNILTESSIQDTTIYKYTSNNNDNQVWYYVMEGFGHSWPYKTSISGAYKPGINASEVIWEFFSQFVE